jgi:hypothetical protein
VKGIQAALVGVGSGGRLTGLTIGGVGIGGAGRVRGIQLAGVGIGSGGVLEGLSIAGIGVGAPRIKGVAAAAAVGGVDVTGGVLAPVFFRIENDGELHGVSIATVNHIKGGQRGLTIGIVNYARRLNGVQIGLVNIVRDNPSGRRVLPIVNWN